MVCRVSAIRAGEMLTLIERTKDCHCYEGLGPFSRRLFGFVTVLDVESSSPV